MTAESLAWGFVALCCVVFVTDGIRSALSRWRDAVLVAGLWVGVTPRHDEPTWRLALRVRRARRTSRPGCTTLRSRGTP